MDRNIRVDKEVYEKIKQTAILEKRTIKGIVYLAMKAYKKESQDGQRNSK